MKRIAMACCFVALAACALPAASQSFPNRPIRFVVPFGPGGPADIAARIVSSKATDILGQPMVIDNRPGAGGVTGSEIVARARPDGHTLLLCSTSVLVFNPLVMPKVPYDPLRDFTHLSLVMSGPYLLLVHPSFPAKDVKELIAVAKSKPGGLNFGSAGLGSAAHLTGERFKSMAGIDMTHVPYKGSGAAAVDLMAGQLHLVFEAVASSLPHVKAGRLRALAVSSLERFALTPNLPTIHESGVSGFESITWQGICAPAGVPKPVVATLNRAIAQAVRSPEAAERLAALGGQAVGNSPEQFLAHVKAEIPRWAKAIKESGAKIR
ncbi:MAG TPA: tripartite tricarboxylate transporter substrate binding protein [Burkholderiales bacterium]|nr:tripartite tricarboxylate transporter substrate binding protein [Burkholderiales bacterium]